MTSEFERTRQTADVALAGRDVPRLVVPELNDPRYGRFEGGALDAYRPWASARDVRDEAPGGGESRRRIVDRYARGFAVLARAEEAVLAVFHSLPIAYVLAAQRGEPPGGACRWSRMRTRTGSPPTSSTRRDVLDGWLAAPTW